MHKCNVTPDAFVYPILIKASGKWGVVFHARCIKMGHDWDRFIRNALIDMYGKFGPLEIARELFDEIPERAVADWNAMISGYWNWGNEVEARGLFDLMDEKSVVTWTAMVTGYSRKKDLENARKVGDLASARELFYTMSEKNVISWNSIIAGYAQNGQSKVAIDLFKDMIAKDVLPDEVTMVSVISACGHLGALEFGNWAVKFLEKHQIKLSIPGYNALIFISAILTRLQKIIRYVRLCQFAGSFQYGQSADDSSVQLYYEWEELKGEDCWMVFVPPAIELVSISHFNRKSFWIFILPQYSI
ncbi:hypothetical protein K7X08_036539 [Anisodus acutangulus]|uniref:Pentatricopeptide repeat-containing protein n=1 Tax=Anisodus acutangulus TaxID=402998 RepID=A0A9Q1QW02_9SOLA|nr:hypothetical protein K7X08_036539 [Anisodus acutangulus]